MNSVAEPTKKELPTDDATPRGFVIPSVNILETPEAYLLEAEMPGINKEGLSIDVQNGVLTLTGRRQPAPQGNCLYQESGWADYRRVFELDPSVDATRISAKLEQGILTLTLPKAEQAKPRRIDIT